MLERIKPNKSFSNTPIDNAATSSIQTILDYDKNLFETNNSSK